MRVIVSPSKAIGSLLAPASKSSMQRACAAALLHNGTTIIYNAGQSNDDKIALDIIKRLGANVKVGVNKIVIESNGFSKETHLENKEISCGESGLSCRMFAPIVALSSVEIILTGSGSLLKRPMEFFNDVFPQLNIELKTNNGFLPMQMKGPLQPHNINIDGSLSSQYLTGLLFAFCASANEEVSIKVNNLKSGPYIDLTLDVMEKFGYNIINHNYKEFLISPKSSINTSIEYIVEGDWSSASFLLVAGAISGKVNITGLNESSTQADKAILKVLEDSGAQIHRYDDSIEVTKSPLKAFTFDATNCPDLFPPLAVLAVYCTGTSIIKGIHRLVAKESNRAESLKEIFAQMGIDIMLKNDQMHITGGVVNNATVSSHHDHRIAMAAAIAALGAVGKIEINNAEAINKSYPSFYNDLQKLGIELTGMDA